jgi:hypothetical protein
MLSGPALNRIVSNKGDMEITLSHSVIHQTVSIDFKEPVSWLSMPLKEAKKLAHRILKQAQHCESTEESIHA